jgi:hypothetical protein
MSKFLATYRHRGSEYSLIIPADSWRDAEEKLRALSQGKIIGSDVQSIPVNAITLPFVGPLGRFLVWWRNQ